MVIKMTIVEVMEGCMVCGWGFDRLSRTGS